MDFISHALIGAIIAELMQLDLTKTSLIIIGSILPDTSVIPVYSYYGGVKRAKDNFFKDKRKKPKLITHIYDFSHSILLMTMVLLLSLIYQPLIFLALGIAIHVLIDIFTHKKHSPRFLYPLQFHIEGIVEWAKLYYSFKSRIIVYGVLGAILLITHL